MTRAAAIVVLSMLLTASAAHGWANPANNPSLLGTPIEDEVYDHATRCKPRSTPGIRLLTRWMERHVRGESWGVYRCEKLSKDTTSLHSEGRALDWHLDVRDKRSRRAAYFFIGRLLATDEQGNPNALARRMGVQEVIYDCRSWFSGSTGLGPYSVCQGGKVSRTTAHRDHVHIGLNRRGARAKTSFWKSRVSRR